MSLLDQIESGNLKVILGSKSPRRSELLALVIPEFEVQNTDCEEVYPQRLRKGKIAQYLSELKSEALEVPDLHALLITADTIVWMGEKVFGKPSTNEEAMSMLRELAGQRHHVYTGVTMRIGEDKSSFVGDTVVDFDEFTEQAIEKYVLEYKPLDKAGAYGIQDCLSESGDPIGPLNMRIISGSYTNVVGLPVKRLKQELSRATQ